MLSLINVISARSKKNVGLSIHVAHFNMPKLQRSSKIQNGSKSLVKMRVYEELAWRVEPSIIKEFYRTTHVVYVVYLKKDKEWKLFDKRVTFRHINMLVKCNVADCSQMYTIVFTENAYNNIAAFTSIFKVHLCDRFSHTMYPF